VNGDINALIRGFVTTRRVTISGTGSAEHEALNATLRAMARGEAPTPEPPAEPVTQGPDNINALIRGQLTSRGQDGDA